MAGGLRPNNSELIETKIEKEKWEYATDEKPSLLFFALKCCLTREVNIPAFGIACYAYCVCMLSEVWKKEKNQEKTRANSKRFALVLHHLNTRCQFTAARISLAYENSYLWNWAY